MRSGNIRPLRRLRSRAPGPRYGKNGEALCTTCAGGLGDFTCTRCGIEGPLHYAGICGRCVRGDRLKVILDDGTVHFDIAPPVHGDQQSEVDRLVSLGATRIDIGQGGEVNWVIMADPDGNEFCVLPPIGRRAGGQRPGTGRGNVIPLHRLSQSGIVEHFQSWA